jgi:hypothetical protein
MRAIVRGHSARLPFLLVLALVACPAETPTDTPPQITLSASSLTFQSIAGSDPAAQVVDVGLAGSTTWTVSDDATWLTLTPATSSFTAFVAVSGLAVGTHTATITVTAPGVANSPQTIPVTLTLTAPPTVSLAPTTLSFSGVQGGTNPAAQNVTVSFSTSGAHAWTATDDASWLAVTPSSGSGGAQLSAAVNNAGMGAGTYTATITVGAPGASNSPQTVSVTLVLTAPPSISLGATQLTFNTSTGSSPPSQNIAVNNGGGGTLTYVATEDATWLSLNATSNVAPATLTAVVSSAGLAAGTYTATITVTATGASNSPQTVAVTLVVTNVTFEGTWVGTTAQDSTIRVVVSNNEITQIYLGWRVASCGSSGSTTTNFTSNRPSVSTGSFSRTVSGSPLGYTISGTFSSGTAVSGTLTLNFSMTVPSSCSGTVSNLSWSATKQ